MKEGTEGRGRKSGNMKGRKEGVDGKEVGRKRMR